MDKDGFRETRSEIRAGQPRVSKVTCEQKNTHNFAISQLRCKF